MVRDENLHASEAPCAFYLHLSVRMIGSKIFCPCLTTPIRQVCPANDRVYHEIMLEEMYLKVKYITNSIMEYKRKLEDSK